MWIPSIPHTTFALLYLFSWQASVFYTLVLSLPLFLPLCSCSCLHLLFNVLLESAFIVPSARQERWRWEAGTAPFCLQSSQKWINWWLSWAFTTGCIKLVGFLCPVSYKEERKHKLRTEKCSPTLWDLLAELPVLKERAMTCTAHVLKAKSFLEYVLTCES